MAGEITHQRTYDMLEPSDGNVDDSMKKLTDVFAPLHAKSWVAETSAFFGGVQYDMNISAFASMWLSKALRIFIAYRDMKPVGYIVAVVFRPLTHKRSILQIEDWFVDSDEDAEKGLFDYLLGASKFMGADEIWINLPPFKKQPELGPAWKEERRAAVVQFVKR